MCHARWIDRSKHRGLCKVCYQKWDERQRAERAAIKARRAARLALQNGVPPVSASHEPTVPEPNGTAKRTYRPDANLLGQELLLEIGAHYEDTRIPTEKIALAYGISNAMLTAAVDLLNLPRRGSGNKGRKMPGRFGVVDGKRTWLIDEPEPEVVQDVPEPVEKALERMLQIPPKPEPLAKPVQRLPLPVALQQVVDEIAPDEQDWPVWRIDYQGSMLIRARDIDQALDKARADGHLTQIVGITLRSR